MSLSIGRVGRLVFRAALALTLVALFLGRYTPRERSTSCADQRTAAHPRYLAIPISRCLNPPYVPRILDTQTTVMTPCRVEDAENLEFLGCSPWRDRAGQHQMAALYWGGSGNRPAHAPGPIELIRCTFPAGKVVDRAIADPIPRGPICWAPDRSDRIVFAAGDGRLYRHDFSEGQGGGSKRCEAKSIPLRWKGKRRRNGRPFYQDPCWPDQPELGRRLLVSVVTSDSADTQEQLPKPRLCWVRPDSDVRRIMEIRRAIIPVGVSPDVEERLPSVGRAADGTLVLAYLVRPLSRPRWELRVAPIAVEPSDESPRVLTSETRRLAEECEAVVPAFSPDGRWIFAALLDTPPQVRIQRFRVPSFAGGGESPGEARDSTRLIRSRPQH
jgi:hypothetical protein